MKSSKPKHDQIYCEKIKQTIIITSHGKTDTSTDTFIPFKSICPHQNTCEYYISSVKNYSRYCDPMCRLQERYIKQLGKTS